MGRKYVVIVGDVVKSRKIRDRLDYWEKLKIVADEINRNYRDVFYAPIVILKGDEISAVLKDPSSTYTIIREFQESFLPYNMRFVAVYGFIDVALETKNASLMDGPAFWKANKYLEEIKKKKKYVVINMGNETIDALITAVANLVAYIKNTWTSRELEIIRLYEKCRNQKKVAEKYGISQQAVSDALKRAYWQIVRDSEDTILKILEKYEKIGGWTV